MSTLAFINQSLERPKSAGPAPAVRMMLASLEMQPRQTRLSDAMLDEKYLTEHFKR